MSKEQNKETKKIVAASAAGAVGGAGSVLGMQYADEFLQGDEVDEAITDTVPANDPAEPEARIGESERIPVNNISDTGQQKIEEDDEIIDGVAFDSNGDGTEDGIAYDLNGDGTIDAVAEELDTDGDGVIDAVAVAVDVNGDGVADMIQMDVNGDGMMDAMTMDYDQDGIMEYGGVDTDGDHVVDSHYVDTNADQSYDMIIKDNVIGNDGGNDDQADFEVTDGDDIAYDMDNDADTSDWA